MVWDADRKLMREPSCWPLEQAAVPAGAGRAGDRCWVRSRPPGSPNCMACVYSVRPEIQAHRQKKDQVFPYSSGNC